MESPDVGFSTYDHRDFPAASLVTMKANATVSVVVPARNEERTIATVVSIVRDGLVERFGIVDEIVVVDDGSLDATAARSPAPRGVRVVPSGAPVGAGKGAAMRRGLEVATGEIVVFLDADVTNLRPHFVTGLLGPLFSRPEVGFVKGFYDRPFHGSPTGGGRVTELAARPVLALCFPELAGVLQPLAGETAARRAVLEALVFEPGYGVEMGMLIDVAAHFGPAAIAQVDLGVRAHRNRPLAELAVQAHEVLSAALSRARVITP